MIPVQAPQLPVSMVDLRARHADVAGSVEAAVADVLRSGRYIGGLDAIEEVAADLLGRTAAVGTASGTDALILALQALEVRPGDEVIVPALSFFATAGAVTAIGACPVIVDVDDRGLLDPERALDALTTRTRAIIPVHLFGNHARLPAVDLPILDDACQAIGRPTKGTLSALSCYPTKIWGAAGDGGFVAGDDPELLARVRRLGHHGLRDRHTHDRVGGWVGRNSRLDPVQAAVLSHHAPRLPGRIARRRAIAARYDAEMPPGCVPLGRDPESPVQQYCILLEDRDTIQERMAARHIETRVYYRRPLSHQPALDAPFATPNADRLSAGLLALPCHAFLTDAHVDAVLQSLHDSMER